MDVHTGKVHAREPTVAVSDGFAMPKLVPYTVSCALPEVGLLRYTEVSTGELYDQRYADVPLSEFALTLTLSALPIPPCETHRTAVSPVQTDVAHSVSPIAIVGVEAVIPKFLPETVIKAPPVAGPLTGEVAVIFAES